MPPRTSQPPVPVNAAAHQAEATALAANILGQAGVAGFQILAPNNLPQGLHADAVWKAGPVIGTVSVVEADGKTKINDIPGILIGGDAQSCRGKFFSGSLPDETDQSPIARVFTSCQAPKATTSMYYIAVPRDQGGGFYLLAMMTNKAEQSKTEPPAEERAKEMENSIRQAVFKVLSK